MDEVSDTLCVGLGHLVFVSEDIGRDHVGKLVADIVVTLALVHLFAVKDRRRVGHQNG